MAQPVRPGKNGEARPDAAAADFERLPVSRQLAMVSLQTKLVSVCQLQ